MSLPSSGFRGGARPQPSSAPSMPSARRGGPRPRAVRGGSGGSSSRRPWMCPGITRTRREPSSVASSTCRWSRSRRSSALPASRSSTRWTSGCCCGTAAARRWPSAPTSRGVLCCTCTWPRSSACLSLRSTSSSARPRGRSTRPRSWPCCPSLSSASCRRGPWPAASCPRAGAGAGRAAARARARTTTRRSTCGRRRGSTTRATSSTPACRRSETLST
mmetsp:Transcript_78764/g.244384  ORF Transcript_78764/g.244384 Transcript_78764/m.244384 type:complete len:218 (+) Transcript_78764:1640-2293(+)